MNYSLHYERLIARARDRVLDGYVERHHVIPKCIGGSDTKDNLVQLTAEEHMVAHLLLVRIHPGNHSLLYAANYMNSKSQNHQRSTNKTYGWLRKRIAIAVGDKHRGKKLSAAHIAILVKRHTGNQYNKGRVLSAEERARVGDSFRGKALSAEHRAKIAAGNSGKPFTEERKAKLRRPKTPEHRAKLSAANLAYHTRARISTGRWPQQHTE